MANPTVEQLLRQATAHHQAKRFGEAEGLYRQILQVKPNSLDVLNLLGVLYRQIGKPDKARDYFKIALELKPEWSQAHINLGHACREVGDIDAAIVAFSRASVVNESNADAFSGLGIALISAKNYPAAIKAFEKALSLRRDSPDLLNNLGFALMNSGGFAKAVDIYKQAVAIRPEYRNAYSNLANALQKNGQTEEAIAAYRQAIIHRPDNPALHVNLGNLLLQIDKRREAIVAFQMAIALDSNFAEAHNNLGIALKEAGQLDQAIVASQRAISINPEFADAHANLAHASLLAGDFETALVSNRRAVQIEPGNPQLYGDLIFSLNYYADYDAKAIGNELARWNDLFAKPLEISAPAHQLDTGLGRRIRIGYVSADFRQHAVARFLEPLLAHHDRTCFEIFAYADVRAPDAMTTKLQSHIDIWTNSNDLSDEKLADQVRSDKIDILVDLALHTSPNRLLCFARKPAPVQVTWLGYPGSTGLTSIDYRLSDQCLDPPGVDESLYSEKTIRLADCYWCYQPSSAAPDVAPPPFEKAGYITFGCLNNFCKVSPMALKTWIEILHRSPNSRLILIADALSSQTRVKDLFASAGIESTRLEFSPRVAELDYLHLYHRVDIALDSFPFAGGTTTLDALWMGVPVVSLAGRSAIGRGGVSILTNLGHSELIADSHDHYIRLASDLSQDRIRLRYLRFTLRNQLARSPLCDGPRFARNVETVYRELLLGMGLPVRK